MIHKGYILPKIVSTRENDGEVKNVDNILLKNNEIASISYHNSGKSPEILLDFGIKTTGYFFIELENSSFDSFELYYGPVKDMLTSKRVVKMPSNGEFFVDDEYIACRYVKLVLKSETALPFTTFAGIRKLGLKFSAYPAVYKGSFKCEDKELNDIWTIGAYTAQICMQKNVFSSTYQNIPKQNEEFIKKWKSTYSPYVIFDGPRRDREVWVGDLRTEGLIAYTAFGAYDVLKSSLVLFHDLQNNDGIVPGCGSTWQSFREYNLWYIVSIWENYLYGGDKQFLEYMYPSVESFLDWLIYNLTEDGLLYNEATWMWTFPREGYGAATQCILYKTLECAACIEDVMENHEMATKLRKIANVTKDTINNLYWDEEKGVYFDLIKIKGSEKVILSDLNGYVVGFGIANEERTKKVLDYMKKTMWNEYGSTTIDKKVENPELTDDAHLGIAAVVRNMPNTKQALQDLMWAHNKQIWPFIVAYEVEGRLVAGDVENAIELIHRCWGNMLNKEPGTFWEMVDAESGDFVTRPFQKYSKIDSMNSAAHGWSGWVSYIMQAYILGIKPVTPGFKTTSISPMPGNLKNLSGSVATPYGIVSIDIESKLDELILKVKKPADIEVVFDVRDDVIGGRKLVTEVQ